MKPTCEEKNYEVRKVLIAATEPIGPTEIARRINQAWCLMGSSTISPVLKRIKAVRHNGGEYTAPLKITI